MNGRILDLDANASAPLVPEARAALVAALAAVDGANPSSPHARGRAARRVLDEARGTIAVALAGPSASPKDVFLTSGASEANRLVVDMLVASGERRGRPFVVVTSPLEHPSFARPLARAAARGQVVLRTLRIVDEDVEVEDDALLQGCDAVVCTAAHNETGLLLRLDALCARIGEDVVVVVDAAQSIGRVGPPPARADVVVASAHKLGGPQGAGALLLRRRARGLALPWVGGGQENGVRPGTEATLLHAAFGSACGVVADTRAAHAALAPLRDRLEAAVVTEAGARALCAQRPRLPNTSAVFIPGVDADALRMLLDQAGVCVGFGAACSALSPEPSAGLRALGLSDDDTRRVVRMSLPTTITDEDVEDAARRILGVVRRLRA